MIKLEIAKQMAKEVIKLICEHCNWSDTKYKVLVSSNGFSCPKCFTMMDDKDYDGFTSILKQEPTETGMYVLKSWAFEIAAILSTNMKGELVWARLNNGDSLICTHWKKINNTKTNGNN